ncbi:MAG TPA: sigma-70 family RNA polymerase sigma factor [Blastocatellia bacterium]|jgi:RNA polymerase sigma factor (TIGR02999 family)
MKPHPTRQITRLLDDWSKGDQAALEQLLPIVYEELRRLAHHYMRKERAGHTLQTTALVHEAYLRLADYDRMRWQDRAHFFAVAAQLMRRILVDYARTRQRLKRGGGAVRVSLGAEGVMSPQRSQELLALDEALTRLAALDQRKSRVVELRLFGGLDNNEVAEVLKVSPNTVVRDWKMATAWLRRELRGAV